MSMRIKISDRESACYIALRKKGHRIQHIALAFGRSTSVVYRRIASNMKHCRDCLDVWGRHLDQRKMPGKTRLFNSRKRWFSLLKYLPLWENWILSEEGKPP